MPASLLHAMTCGRVRRWTTCVLHTVSDSGSGHAHTEGFCSFRLVGTRRSFRTSGVHHLEEVRATNWGNGVYVGAQANGARTIKERSVGHSWRRTPLPRSPDRPTYGGVGSTAAVGNARERMSDCSRYALHSGRSAFGQTLPFGRTGLRDRRGGPTRTVTTNSSQLRVGAVAMLRPLLGLG